MSGQPLLSVIILNRNHARSLPRLLLSLRRQTTGLSGTEIIFTDMGSTDGSEELIRNWEKRLGCRNLVFISAAEQHGHQSALGTGMQAASGEFLLPISAEDHLDPVFFERCLDVLAGTPFSDIAYSGYVRSEGKTSRIIQSVPFSVDEIKHRDIIGPAAMMRREVWEETGAFRPGAVYQNWDFWIRACIEGFAFTRIPGHLYFQAESSAVGTTIDPNLDARAKARIVIKNQSFYSRETIRWALGRLRNEPWAKGFEPGVIPDAEDVRRLLSDFILSAMDFKRRRNADDIDPYLRLLVA